MSFRKIMSVFGLLFTVGFAAGHADLANYDAIEKCLIGQIQRLAFCQRMHMENGRLLAEQMEKLQEKIARNDASVEALGLRIECIQQNLDRNRVEFEWSKKQVEIQEIRCKIREMIKRAVLEEEGEVAQEVFCLIHGFVLHCPKEKRNFFLSQIKILRGCAKENSYRNRSESIRIISDYISQMAVMHPDLYKNSSDILALHAKMFPPEYSL